MESPSSRRAWIEIQIHKSKFPVLVVALLAEGVDRNSDMVLFVKRTAQSPSSRRAWIEILKEHDSVIIDVVALLAEGVDRNNPSGF